ncbi:hypothetical protein A3I45_02090 [Candidatus Uhrbacteria bacterium RIFCSPLOWO2_02_FULL_53_10]|uniref:Transcription regulator TrmB N-terminal domain-containing protein n=1 Tax=Candidatus Uhrbacteria bacterium RIFCSPLOWO2_02_FULL_53_10 TaxID=1802411 RepID=A0A1F7VH85_9BACT|nr:MAG: hypothetical protein A3I45_02090 [Candidatus Uhrbacteria bacterium RIFCSPLOWO2_02_FULL_53_10]
MKHLIEPLSHAGLNDREARVYLAALSLGSSGAQEIAHAADVLRSSVYDLLDALMEIGLVHQLDCEGMRKFTAEPPERMVDVLQTQVDQLVRRRAILEQALPELTAIEYRQAPRPKVFYFEGREGIRRLSKRYEEQPAPFVEIVPLETVRAYFHDDEFEAHRQTLVKRRIKGRVLFVAKQPPVDVMKQVFEQYGWQSRHVELGEQMETGHVSVKGDEVYAFSYDQIPIGVVIESAPIAASLRRVFDLAWHAAGQDGICYPPVRE